jgi:hypothetical protein
VKIFAKSRNGKMVKAGETDKSCIWYFLDEPVVKFVETGIKVGDEVTIKYEQNNGKNTITYITKGKGENQKSNHVSNTNSNNTLFKCEECGAILKDGKYKKCYICNQKNPPKKGYSSPNLSSKSPEDKEQIKRLSILSSAVKAVQAVTGQVDVNSLAEYVLNLYKEFYKKLSE